MLETKGGRIALLIFMAAVLIYTAFNYANGKTNILILGVVTVGAVLLIKKRRNRDDD